MEWLGVIAFIMIMCYSSYPDKVKKLEANMKKIEKREKRELGGNGMSKLISELINKECKIKIDEAMFWIGNNEVTCLVLDVDDEWVKIRYTDKKGKQIVKIVRIESIDEVELLEEQTVS